MVHAQEINVHRKTIVETPFAYEDLCGRFEAAVGRLDAPAVRRLFKEPFRLADRTRALERRATDVVGVR